MSRYVRPAARRLPPTDGDADERQDSFDKRHGRVRAPVSRSHRIDEALVKSQVEAAGFKLEGESKLLRNPGDDRTLSIFDKKIQGHTDQLLLKFRKLA